MPYRVMGKNLEHKKRGKWVIKQHCKNHENALKAKRLLEGLNRRK